MPTCSRRREERPRTKATSRPKRDFRADQDLAFELMAGCPTSRPDSRDYFVMQGDQVSPQCTSQPPSVLQFPTVDANVGVD